MKKSLYYYLLLTAIYAGIFLAARAQKKTLQGSLPVVSKDSVKVGGKP